MIEEKKKLGNKGIGETIYVTWKNNLSQIVTSGRSTKKSETWVNREYVLECVGGTSLSVCDG